MKKKMDYCSFVCFSGVIFFGSVDLHATMQEEIPFQKDSITGTRYRKVSCVGKDGKKVTVVEQKCPGGIFRWKKSCDDAIIIFPKGDSGADWAKEVRLAARKGDLRALKKLLNYYGDPEFYINCYPNLLFLIKKDFKDRYSKQSKSSTNFPANAIQRSVSLAELSKHKKQRSVNENLAIHREIVDLLVEFGYQDEEN
jgi:hypothetical protein